MALRARRLWVNKPRKPRSQAPAWERTSAKLRFASSRDDIVLQPSTSWEAELPGPAFPSGAWERDWMASADKTRRCPAGANLQLTLVPKLPLGNAPPRSSASHPRATTSSYSHRPHRKQSFPDLRSQAELGNEIGCHLPTKRDAVPRARTYN